MTDDRQTDHATEKCAGIGGIVCAARAIPLKKRDMASQSKSTVQRVPVEVVESDVNCDVDL